MPRSLTAEALRQCCPPEQLPFETTAELAELEGNPGQERALEALEFGLAMRADGYHVFVMAPASAGALAPVLEAVRQRAAVERTPPDWCYVHSFAEPRQPMALQVPSGRGNLLRADARQLVDDLSAALPATFESDEFRVRRDAIAEQLKERQIEATSRLQAIAEARGAAVIRTPTGVAFAPMRDGKVLEPDEFEALPDDEKHAVEATLSELHSTFRQMLDEVPRWEKEQREAMRLLQREITAATVDRLVAEVRERWRDQEGVRAWLEAVREDIVDNVGMFLAEREEGPALMRLAGMARDGGDPHQRYQVNVIVDHSETRGAPVVHLDHPTAMDLVGHIEHRQIMGALVTDFTLVRGGALHRANGGYLVIDVRRLLQAPLAWEELKRALYADTIRIEPLERRLLGMVHTVTLEPQPIPLSIKVILMGEARLYWLLHQLDPDFSQLFKVLAELDEDRPRTEQALLEEARLVATLAQREGLRALDRAAAARVLEERSRQAGDRQRLSARVPDLRDLLHEADHHAGRLGHAVIGTEAVQAALDARERREGRLRERVADYIGRDIIHVATDGAVEGQVNGLSVLQIGRTAFGRPARITARVGLGPGRILDIEREVHLGGPLHSKGVLIIGGFLRDRFGRSRALPLAASLVFEQSYGGVDGDSASLGETVALLSALAEVPVQQRWGITGSMDQRGRAQAVGGINEKVEGFYDVCAARGLTGDQGVILPAANADHLLLRPRVVEAVRAGAFQVVLVETVDEALELMTGLPLGVPDAEGRWPDGSLGQRIVARLAELAAAARELAPAAGPPSAAPVEPAPPPAPPGPPGEGGPPTGPPADPPSTPRREP